MMYRGLLILAIYLFPALALSEPLANNLTEAGEACDGTDLNGQTCVTLAPGFVGGTLHCRADRSGYDVTGCVSGGKVVNVVNNAGVPSCQAADVQRTINSSNVADGDTVQIAAGTCIWTTPVTIGAFNGATRTYSSKSLLLKGAGIDQTVIIEELASPAAALSLNIQAGKPVRITGITFDGSKTVDNYASITISANPGQPMFRVDHCKFKNVSERGIIVGSAYGLIDHNEFLRIPIGFSATLISVIGDVGGVNDSMMRPLDQGTSNAVYIEDNTFVHNIQANGPFDMYEGARYVFRNNNVLGNGLGHHGFDSSIRGVANFEIYNNKFTNGIAKESPHFSTYAHVAKSDFTATDPVNGAANLATLINKGILEEFPPDRVRLKNPGVARPAELPSYTYNRIWGNLNGAFVHGIVFEFRSGTGVVFGNVAAGPIDPATSDTGAYDLFGMLRNYRSSDGYITNYGYTFPWDGKNPSNGVCDGTNALDGNSPGMAGYPCKDQIGRAGNQTLAPVYSWNNTYKGVVNGHMVVGGYATPPPGGADRITLHLVEGRDFYNGTAKPNYYPFVYPHPLAALDGRNPQSPGSLRVTRRSNGLRN